MFLFSPSWVVMRQDSLGNEWFLSTFNHNMCYRHAATKFWFKWSAEAALRRHLAALTYNQCIPNRREYEVVNLIDLGE